MNDVVVREQHSKKNLSKRYQPISTSIKIGALSGVLEAIANHWLWVWKIRSQNNLGFTCNPLVISRGITTNMCSVSTIVAARMTLNDQFIKLMYQTENPSILQSNSSAFCAGLAAAPISSVIELGMTQQQKVQNNKKSGTFISTYVNLIKTHGLKRGFVGLPSTFFRDGTFCTAFLGTAPHLKASLQSQGYVENNKVASINAGLLAGFPAAVIAHPFDTVAAVQHNNASSTNQKDVSAWHVANKIFKEEGIKGFYRKGFLPRALRMVSATAIFVEASEVLGDKFNSPNHNL